MNREELTNRMQEGFFELAPDIFDEIVEAIEHPVENAVISLPERKKSNAFFNKVSFKVLSRVAMIILVIGLGFSIYGLEKNQDVYVVAMDVNPSIRMELNENYDVRRIIGLNTDGEEIISKLEWEKNSSIEKTVGTITDKLISEGYLTENGGILITLLKKDENHDYEELKSILNQELENDVVKCGVMGVKVAFQSVDKKTDKTGKEILKEHMIEEYHIDNDRIDEMNIGDMLDYIENEQSDNQILENMSKPNEGKNVDNTGKHDNKNAVSKENGKKKDKQPAKNSTDTENNNNQSTETKVINNKPTSTPAISDGNNSGEQEKTVADVNNKKEVDNKTGKQDNQTNNQNNQDKQNNQDEQNNENNQNNQNKQSNRNNQYNSPYTDNNNWEKWIEEEKGDWQKEWQEQYNWNNTEKWQEPEKENHEEDNQSHWYDTGNANNQEKWSQSDKWNEQQKLPGQDNMNNQDNQDNWFAPYDVNNSTVPNVPYDNNYGNKYKPEDGNSRAEGFSKGKK